MTNLPPPPPPPPTGGPWVTADPVGGAPLPPTWMGPALPAASRRRPRSIFGGLLLILGGAVAMVGSALPWADIDSSEYSGLDTRGKTTIVLGAVVAVLGVAMLFRRLVLLALAAVIASIAILVAAGMTVRDVLDARDFTDASVGVGLWVTLAAGLVSLVGGIAALAKRRRP
jgi:hypothetical protein